MVRHRGKLRVGIRELKDDASKLIEQVSRTGVSITITNHEREVARIVPLSHDDIGDKLQAHGLAAEWLEGNQFSSLELEALRLDAMPALKSIEVDREEA